MGPAWGPSCGGRIVWASLGNKEDPLRNPERNCPKAPHIVTTQRLSCGCDQVDTHPGVEYTGPGGWTALCTCARVGPRASQGKQGLHR